MSTKTGKDLDLIKPAVTDNVLQTIADLASNFQDIDDGHTSHKAEKAPHANIPIAKITSSVAQSIPTGAGSWTTLFFDTKVFDTDNMYDSDYTDRLTCRTAGRYLIIAKAIFYNNATGHRSFQILKNGSVSPPIVRGDYFPPNYCGMSISTLEVLEEGDYISVQVIQTSGNALNIGNSSLMMIRM